MQTTTSKLSRFLAHINRDRFLLLLFLPGMAAILVFSYGPLYGLQLAFKDYIFADGIWGSPWIGLHHFRIFTQPIFGRLIANTLIISCYRLLFGFPATILFALLINELVNAKLKGVVQTISYLPHFLSWIIVAGLVIEVLSPSRGIFPYLTRVVGLEPPYLLAHPRYFRGVLVVSGMWKSIGWGSIIYLASIAHIDPELYESADIDGANRLRKALHITLPHLLPVTSILLIFNLTGLFTENFDQIFNLYNPLVFEVSDVIETYVYRVGLAGGKFEQGIVVGVFNGIIAFILLLVANRVVKGATNYGVW